MGLWYQSSTRFTRKKAACYLEEYRMSPTNLRSKRSRDYDESVQSFLAGKGMDKGEELNTEVFEEFLGLQFLIDMVLDERG